VSLAVVFALIAIAVGGLFTMYLSWTAGRLDRLHNRTDAAWASLDAQLVRRAALAGEIAHAAAERGVIGPDARDRLSEAAQRALGSDREERADVENGLGHALRDVLGDEVFDSAEQDERLRPMLAALDAAMTKVILARRFHATAVEDTLGLRRKRPVRWFRLAGSAALPAYFDIDDTPVARSTSTALRPR
jgi:hypothetical protein